MAKQQGYAPSWESPKTTKLYLHPPFSKKLVTLWPDYKVLKKKFWEKIEDGEIEENASGFIILYGDDMQQIPWEDTSMFMDEGGIPIQKMKNSINGLDMELEGFCNLEQNPAAFLRLKINNSTTRTIEDTVSILSRTGSETYLTSFAGYNSYEPTVNSWLMLPPTWKYIENENKITDGENTIVLKCGSSVNLEWVNSKAGVPLKYEKFLKISFSLHAKQEEIIDIFFADDEAKVTSFEQEKKAVIKSWENILSKIIKYPKTKDYNYKKMHLHIDLYANCYPQFQN